MPIVLLSTRKDPGEPHSKLRAIPSYGPGMSIYAKLYRWYGGDSMTRACSGPGIVTICLSATNAFSSSSWRRAASTVPPSGFIALALLMHSRIVFPGAYSAHACRRASTFKLLFVVERGCIECGSLVAPRPQFGYPFL